MLTKIKLGLGAVSVMLMIGCGGQVGGSDISADQASSESAIDGARRRAHPEFYSCQADSDCVAVEQAGCCPNGYLVAVNQSELQAYDAQYACQESSPICPLYVVKDTRVAQCNYDTHQCQMIDPTEIRCGGFIDPSLQHWCPTGFTCHYQTVPDVPGTCVADSQ